MCFAVGGIWRKGYGMSDTRVGAVPYGKFDMLRGWVTLNGKVFGRSKPLPYDKRCIEL